VKRVWALAFVLACHATADQIGQTIADGAKVGACIAVSLLQGKDPLTCTDATEQLVVDVINDVEAKQSLSPDQKDHLNAERVRMASRLAAKAPGK